MKTIEEAARRGVKLLTVRVWVVWDYEALPCQISKNLNTRYND